MKKEKKKEIPEGTFRISSKNLKTYVYKNKEWVQNSKKKFPNAQKVIELYKSNNSFEILVDSENPGFLKGQLSPECKTQGTRIPVLPDGRKLDKAFSLFSENLTIHDELSNTHWDVLYKNPGGTYSYVYTIDKDLKNRKNKYDKVKQFEKIYEGLESNTLKALEDPEDSLAVPMFTLLKTYMRVGNEIYYKAHGHKGLTTLKKKDLTIKGNQVTFNYLGKDGVPIKITKSFPAIYIKKLKNKIKNLNPRDFIFTDSSGNPLKEKEFKKAFKRYCGIEFYPHIVRSYRATLQSEKFLEEHSTATKQEVNALFLEIAEELGHKKFSKKTNEWDINPSVTIHHYIKPELVDEIQSLVGKEV